MSVKVQKPGMLTTIQDPGRYGYQGFGVMAGGWMDAFAGRVSNWLVGNKEDEAVLEITLQGPELYFEKAAWIAVCGADLSATCNGESIPLWRPVYLPAHSTLQFAAPEMGCRAYLSVRGGWDVQQCLGSRATDLRAGWGGVEGRKIKAGDVLSCHDVPAPKTLANMVEQSFRYPRWFVSMSVLPKYRYSPVIRLIKGPEYDALDEQSKANLWNGEFKVSRQADRMGYRLTGPPLHCGGAEEMQSGPVTEGTIQVPGPDEIIVLMADRQTTGGYPRVAQVASVDLPVLAQLQPGDELEFEEISWQDAQAEWIHSERMLSWLRQGILAKWNMSAEG